MGVSTALTPDSPIVVPTRRSIHLDDDLVTRIANDRSGDLARTTAWTAMVAGDRPAIRTIASAYLASTSNAPAGISRERWLVMGAAAHADQVAIGTVADLATFLDAMSDGLVLMQLATMDFGARRPGALDNPVSAARTRIAETVRVVERLCDTGRAEPWTLVRNLSYFGDLLLSGAVSRALLIAGDTGHAEIVRAAHIRRIHHHPEMTVEIADSVLANTLHPWALNTKAASLGDLGQFRAAADLALVSIAVHPNEYSGNVGRRAFRNIARLDLSELADRIAIVDASRTKPSGFDGDRFAYLRLLAAELLNVAGRRDLAELPLGRLNSAPFARVAREAIDIGASPVAAVAEAGTTAVGTTQAVTR